MKIFYLGIILSCYCFGSVRVDFNVEGRLHTVEYVDIDQVQNYQQVSEYIFKKFNISSFYDSKIHAYTMINGVSNSNLVLNSHITRHYGWCFDIKGQDADLINSTIEQIKLIPNTQIKLNWFQCYSDEFIYFSQSAKKVSQESIANLEIMDEVQSYVHRYFDSKYED